MATNSITDPKVVTVRGRLSFPSFTAQEAYDLSQRGSYPSKSPGETAPHFQLLLDDVQFQKMLDHCEKVFLPYCIEQNKAGEKKDSLDAKEVARLIEGLNGDLDDQLYNTPLKAVHEKTAALAPEAVATMKVIGNKGVDISLKAVVQSESELAVPDPDQLKFPCIRPINETVHEFYPGCEVAVTLNLYAYHNGKNPGFSAGASTAVFRADNDRFGGGVAVDEDAIFLDD